MCSRSRRTLFSEATKMTYITDEKLKSFLDTNQLHREQMCLAILALDKRFSEVRPRQPRGGPDGGRDIEALFRGGERAYAAVGFVNQADDSPAKKRRTTVKFRADLNSALSASPVPTVFVFLTNIAFTPGEKEGLEGEARAKGIGHCEIFDRERLRIALDSPDGFAVRFQYLAIPLSEAEQASFFAKWGDEVNSVITTGFQKVQHTLDQLLFLQEATFPLSSLVFSFELDRQYKGAEIGHFRAYCSLYLKEPKFNTLSILFGSTDIAKRLQPDFQSLSDLQSGIQFGISGGQWEQYLGEDDEPPGASGQATTASADVNEKYEKVGSSSSIGMQEVDIISIRYHKNWFIRLSPVLSLRDLDEAMFLPILSRSLAHKVNRIHAFANGYKLFEVSRSSFNLDESEFDPNIPVQFSQAELTDAWVRIRPITSSAFEFVFSEETPRRLYVSRQVLGSWPKGHK